jgi:tRNA uridine 5-carboxymethylaminomethyl modification enzyme
MERSAIELGDLRDEVVEQLEIGVKYHGYLDKERELAVKLSKMEEVPLGPDLEYSKLASLSMEARQKLDQVRPRTLGQAARISGISPADVGVLLVYLGR